MGKKNGKGQQRAAAKKKRRAARIKKRTPQNTEDYLDDLGEMFLPDFAYDEPRVCSVIPMWEYDDPEVLAMFKEDHPGSTDADALEVMFAEPVRARTLAGYAFSLPPWSVLGLYSDATGEQMLTAAKRRFNNGDIIWDKDELVHIAPDIQPDPLDAFDR